MALATSSILKSPKFLCKYVRISPPSTVVCYVHSQLAVQPYDVQRPCIFMFNKGKKTDKGNVSGKETDNMQGLFSFHGEGKVSLHKSENQPLKSLRQNKGTFEMCEKPKDASSVMTKWNHNPLMDHKQLVLMIFKEDAFTRRASLAHGENLLNSAIIQEKKKKPLKASAGKLKTRQTFSTSVHKSWKGQAPRLQQLKEQVPQMSHSNQSMNNSISEAAMLFADFCSAGSDVQKQDGKKVFKSGPDPTQLSSVLLELRERIPEFFQKKPNYTMYHKKIKFVNNITGITTHGIYPYRSQVSGLRLLMLSCMAELSVDVLKITKHPNEAAIKVRWRIKGIPLVRKLAPFIGRRVKVDADGFRYLDGFSVFEVGSDGLIHCHRLHKVMPTASKEKESPLWMVIFLPLINVLNPRQCESFFECSSTDKEIEPVAADSDAIAC
ncbi:hypothetical protein ACROYT_G002949 [Oculina patagonica]